jgi:hypothetical protein
MLTAKRFEAQQKTAGVLLCPYQPQMLRDQIRWRRKALVGRLEVCDLIAQLKLGQQF